MTNHLPQVSILKDQAKRLRAALEERDQPIPHSAALEIVARQYGFRDWNTAYARAGNTGSASPLNVGDRVEGKYLGHPFRGTVRGIAIVSSGKFYRTCIEFDEPVDIIRFDSFSANRKRITSVINPAGISPRKTGDGVPHLQLAL